MEIAYINARVDVMASNISEGKEDPPYVAYDAHGHELARCHTFQGTDATLMYTDGVPRRVVLVVEGHIELDPEGGNDAVYSRRLMPSSTGMYRPKPKPIKDLEGNTYLSCKLIGPYTGVYDPRREETPLYVDCEQFIGVPA